MPYNPERNPLRFAVTDYVWDQLQAEGVLDDISDEFWTWWEEAVEKPVMALICEVDGHEPMADQCNKPEHDHCGICHMPMRGQAPHRAVK